MDFLSCCGARQFLFGALYFFYLFHFLNVLKTKSFCGGGIMRLYLKVIFSLLCFSSAGL
jgi:hypothetical protein